MELSKAIITVENYLETGRKLKENKKTTTMSDYDKFVFNNYNAIETILNKVKSMN